MPHYNNSKDSKDTKDSYIEFEPPKGFVIPEHQGKEFELVCTFEVKPDGMICMTKLGDTELDKEDDHDERKDDKPGYGDYHKGMMSAMESAGGNSGMGGGGY
jgi:hypothetical protein